MKTLNHMTRALLVGATLIGSLALPAAAHSADKSKVVIQVSDNDPAKWNLALNNAKNIQKDVGTDNVVIEIVAFGPGVNMLKAESEVGNRIGDAVDTGVQVNACQNTMRNFKLSKEDMNTKVGYVPSGVVEIMRRQQEGYSYLRP